MPGIQPARPVSDPAPPGTSLIGERTQDGTDPPVGTLQVIARNTDPPRDMRRWRKAESALVYAALSRGDYSGAEAARKLISQEANSTVIENLEKAYTHLLVGDAVGAAIYLAKAHAFVPKEWAARFGVDERNYVYGAQFDPETGAAIGAWFRVTPQSVRGLLSVFAG